MNFHFSPNGVDLDPKKVGGKLEHGLGLRTRLSTFLKSANNMQNEGDHEKGVANNDVSETSTCFMT